MKKLFAAHFLQTVPSTPIPLGQYDPEQGLWVSDNQLQGVSPFATETGTNTKNHTTHSLSTVEDSGGILDPDLVTETDTTSDSDTDSDNP
jgi:hypothetical protein